MRNGRLRRRGQPSRRSGGGYSHLLLVHHCRVVRGGRRRCRRDRLVRRVGVARVGDRRVRRVHSRMAVAVTVMVRLRRRRCRRTGMVLLLLVIVHTVFHGVRGMARRDGCSVVLVVPRALQLLPDVARGDEGGGRRGRRLRRRGQVRLVPRWRPAHDWPG